MSEFKYLKRSYRKDWHPFQRATYLNQECWKTWDKSQESENVKFIPAGNLFTLGLVLR